MGILAKEQGEVSEQEILRGTKHLGGGNSGSTDLLGSLLKVGSGDQKSPGWGVQDEELNQ